MGISLSSGKCMRASSTSFLMFFGIVFLGWVIIRVAMNKKEANRSSCFNLFLKSLGGKKKGKNSFAL
jgi:cbb3-type cytochrome oxidase subunit 3